MKSQGSADLKKRSRPWIYSYILKTRLEDHFEKVLFLSEPYYPPNKIDGSNVDKHILFLYGRDLDGNFTMKLAVQKDHQQVQLEFGSGNDYVIENSLSDLYDNGLEYTSESVIDISVGERGVYICDGVNPIHKVSVDSRGTIVASWVGLKAPSNKPRLSVEPLNKRFDNLDSDTAYTDSSGLGGIGLIRSQYTVVSDTGQESNPSPASDFTNAQFFKIAADGIADERLIKSITVQDLNIPSVPVAVEEYIS